ncbi:MAG: nucleotidyl transferase AbiEii/AbiGii toxin family protein [Candidatus Nealsonbacteria bacterium]|nr:nucleotidyl transferase AbiEii/AbiGii toxin family protein [Candidatus Nealsonbacteria bacterium]
MGEQISIILKRKLDDLAAFGGIDAETRRNALKEELQFYVLNFIYYHPKYNAWTMYGGSAFRIIHGLDRMSVDLDFEVSHVITEKFLKELKKEIEDYFANTYGTGTDFLTIKLTTGRGLLLKFYVGEELSLGHPSKQVHVKIDLNHFVAPKIVTERRPINHGQLSFVIVAYNMSALMASKIAAIFLREQRGVDKNIYNYKGRDIYDLLWYMNKKVVPDFDYLNAKLKEKGIKVWDIKTLFDKLTVNILNYEKMDDLLKEDLIYLFEDRTRIENWLKNWRESYLRLLDDYKIRTVTTLDPPIIVYQDFHTDSFHFLYSYKTEDGGSISIAYLISDYWIDFRDGDLPIKIDKKLEDKIEFSRSGVSSRPVPQDKLKQYAALFYQKTENYFKKTNRIMLGDSIITKIIRMTADNLNPKEQIVLNKSALIHCELDNLLK